MKERFLALLAAILLLSGVAIAQQPVREASAVEQGFYKEANFGTFSGISVTTAGTAITGWAQADLAAFTQVCTRDSGTGTLDTAIQRSVDGTNWANIATFTQLAGSGTQTIVYADVRAATAQMMGNRLRANLVIGGTAAYTCTLTGAAEG